MDRNHGFSYDKVTAPSAIEGLRPVAQGSGMSAEDDGGEIGLYYDHPFVTEPAVETEGTDLHREYTGPYAVLSDGTRLPAPLAKPEQLTPMQAFRLNRDPGRATKVDRYYQLGCACLEAAFCATSPDLRGRSLAQARSIFAHCEQLPSRYVAAAGRMLAFEPTWEPRSRQEEYTPEVLQLVYQNISLHALAAASNETAHDLGDFYEDAFMGVAASGVDQDYLVHPATVREEAISPKEYSFNQDGSIYRQGYKIPLQFKGAQRDVRQKVAPEVMQIRVRHTLTHAAVQVYGADYWGAWQPPRRSTYNLPPARMKELAILTGEVLVADAAGRPLEGQAALYLATLKDIVWTRIDTIVAAHHKRVLRY